MVMNEKQVQALRKASERIENALSDAYNLAVECLQVIRIYKYITSRFGPSQNKKGLLQEKAFQKAHKYVLDGLKELRNASGSFLSKKFPVLAKAYAAEKLTLKAINACKQCPNIMGDVEPETCPVLQILSELKNLFPGPGKNQRR